MISLTDTQEIIITILRLFAFVFSITLSGTLQAQISKWMGDNTATQMGFGDFNPFVHIQFIDVVFFALLDIMLGRPIPIDGKALPQQNKLGRFFVIFSTRVITHVLLAVLSLLAFGFLSGTEQQPTHSFVYLLQIFSGIMFGVNAVLAGFYLIRDSVYGFVSYKYSRDPRFIEYANSIMVFGVLLILIIFGQSIFYAVQNIINNTAQYISSWIGG